MSIRRRGRFGVDGRLGNGSNEDIVDPPPVVIGQWELDFTTGSVAHGVFSRTGTASYYNSTANDRDNRHKTSTAADGTPAFEYPMADGICRGVLVRPGTMEYVGANTDDPSAWTVESTSIASVTQNHEGIDGTANTAWTLVGTDKAAAAVRYGISQTPAANGMGALNGLTAAITYTVGSGHPTPGQILMVTDAAAANETGIAYVQTVDTGTPSMQVIMLSGTISNTDKLFPAGTTTVLCTATAAAADTTTTALIEPYPAIAWARVKKSDWPFFSIRVRTESNVNRDYLFDVEYGQCYADGTDNSAASVVPSDSFGIEYLHSSHDTGATAGQPGWYLIWVLWYPKGTFSSAQAKVVVGFGKPYAYRVTGTGTNLIRGDIVYGRTSGARGQLRFPSSRSNGAASNIFILGQEGDFQNGEVVCGYPSQTQHGVIVVDESHATPYNYTKSYTYMTVPTNAAGSAWDSIDASAYEFIMQDAGITRGFCLYRSPVVNTVTYQEPTNPTTYYIQNPEVLSFDTAEPDYEFPANDFSLLLKTYCPQKAHGNRWLPSFLLTTSEIIHPFNSEYAFKCTTGGTSGSSEPDWTTISAVNQTKADGTATWTSVAKHKHYLFACGDLSVYRNNTRLYVDIGGSSINWAVNDSLLRYRLGTSALASPTAGATVTGALSGATGVLLADASLHTESGTWAGINAVGYFSIRVTSGVFHVGENLTIGGNQVAVSDGTAQRTNGGVFEQGEYNIGVHKHAGGVELWVNGHLVASSAAAWAQADITVGPDWYLGSDTNGTFQSGWLYRGVKMETD